MGLKLGRREDADTKGLPGLGTRRCREASGLVSNEASYRGRGGQRCSVRESRRQSPLKGLLSGQGCERQRWGNACQEERPLVEREVLNWVALLQFEVWRRWVEWIGVRR